MGSVLVLEAILVPAHTAGSGGKLRLTGSLGEVISESAELALSWVRSRIGVLGVDVGLLRDNDIHVSTLSEDDQVGRGVCHCVSTRSI